jgi:hypothetical protein
MNPMGLLDHPRTIRHQVKREIGWDTQSVLCELQMEGLGQLCDN